MKIDALLKAIQTAVKGRLPSLRQCDIHGGRFDGEELKRRAARTPAVLIVCLGADKITPSDTGARDLHLALTAFIITRDTPKLTRQSAAMTIAETVIDLVTDNRFTEGAFPAERVKMQNLYAGPIDRHGVALWAVSWVQRLRTGAPAADQDGKIPEYLYVGISPDTGRDHIDDYVEVVS